jgi:hypothetical protein
VPKLKLLTTFFCLILVIQLAHSQNKCGIVEHTNRLRSKKLLPESEQQFEQWMKSKMKESAGPFRKKSSHYIVPVVFHIIHDGEPYGTGRNIPDEQIYSQLRVLNEDFQRRNADASQTPSEFESVAGSMDIEFVIARQDPDGKPTTGITRTRGSKSGYSSWEEYEIKSLSYWPAEDYLNIWVFDFLDYLGLAQYPVSNLPGMEGSPDIRETDGMMVQYRAFGSIDDGNFDLMPQYNKGRTVPHELGHFFGLRHIWGDASGCTGTDYVDDTPNQDGSSSGCPKYPHKTCSPAVSSMFMNFMDYTDDECMNLFTEQQVDRMKIVIENSPRRVSLLSSPGLLFPEPIDNDLAFVESDPIVQCTNTVLPSIWVKNAGKNEITSAQISLSEEGSVIETKQFPLALPPGESTLVTFSQAFAGAGIFNFEFKIVKVNGVDDVNEINNSEVLKVVVNKEKDFIPLKQDFEDGSFKETWTIINPNGGMNWDTIATNHGYSLYFNAFNNFNIGDRSWLVSPTLDFSNYAAASMLFDVSYAERNGIEEELEIYVSEDCGQTYSRTDYQLPSTIESDTSWVPSRESDWMTDQYIDLTTYAGQDDIRIAFAVKNKSTNNLFLDNIEIYTIQDPRAVPINSQYSVFGYDAENFSSSTLKVGFHLNERQNVHCEIIDSQGKQIATMDLADVLNQLYELPLNAAVAKGLYVLTVRINGKTSAKRFFNTK